METVVGPARTVPKVLRDGSVVHLRRADRRDAAGVLELLRSLSLHSRAMRFGTAAIDLPSAARGALEHRGVIAFVADGNCVGHAWYVPTTTDHAEVALLVADRYRGRGLGTILLRKLAAVAASRGISAFEGYVIPENTEMSQLIRGFGHGIRTRPEAGFLKFEITTSAPSCAMWPEGKVAVITGAAKGIGLATTESSSKKAPAWSPRTEIR